MTGGSSGMGARSGVAQGGRLGHRHAARILQGCILVLTLASETAALPPAPPPPTSCPSLFSSATWSRFKQYSRRASPLAFVQASSNTSNSKGLRPGDGPSSTKDATCAASAPTGGGWGGAWRARAGVFAKLGLGKRGLGGGRGGAGGVMSSGGEPGAMLASEESQGGKVWQVYEKSTTPFLRYSISCTISNVLYFGLYLLLLQVIPSAGLAVTIAYMASVTWQHALHRIVVYGKGLNLSPAYFRELAGIYGAYSIALVLNPFITEGVVKAGQAHILHTGALGLEQYLKPSGFVVSLVLTGILNFFTVSAVFEASENKKA